MGRRNPDFIDIETYDCGELSLYVWQALDEKRRPTAVDLVEIGKYNSMQMFRQMLQLYREEAAGKRELRSLLHNWQDCLGYALLCTMVNEEMAEYHYPKKRWVSEPKPSSAGTVESKGGIVGFEFPTLDFIMCLCCAHTSPQTLKEAVEDATGASHPETFFQIAKEQFAIRETDPVVHLLNCDLMECQKPLVVREDDIEAAQPLGE